MVRLIPFRVLLVALVLLVVAACGGQIPDGWHVVDANDIERSQSLRAISCGESLEVGLIVNDGEVSADDKSMIDQLALVRRAADARIVRPDAQALEAIFSMSGITVLIVDEAARSWSPLISNEITNSSEPVAVILDLPIGNFTTHFAVLTDALSVDNDAALRAIATTAQVSAFLSHRSLHRLESVASVCAVYPDAMLKPLSESN